MKELNQENIRTLPNSPGIYKIYALTSRKSRIVIRRFAKDDKSGLIYIGRTIKQTLRKRLENFLITHNSKGTTNHFGALKLKSTPIIKSKFGKDYKIYFTYEPCSDPKSKEKEYLQDYRNRFGETPLLNG